VIDLRNTPFNVRFVPADANPHPLDENIDVEVTFDNGNRYVATFFTLENIRMLIQKYKRTGECHNGLYFWASDMIILERLTPENVQKAVVDLLEHDEFEAAFSGPFNDETDASSDE
jgi:hypothetical protein